MKFKWLRHTKRLLFLENVYNNMKLFYLGLLAIILFVAGCTTNTGPVIRGFSCIESADDFLVQGSKIISSNGSCDFTPKNLTTDEYGYSLLDGTTSIFPERELSVDKSCAESINLYHWAGRTIMQDVNGKLYTCAPHTGGI